ncbi:MAG: hypothetical protein LBD59_11070, partial [Prevotellaceae bacterium]|nr:hypothetical protein [Prevotellaceae bacterium]
MAAAVFASRRDASLGRTSSHTRICIPQGCIPAGCKIFLDYLFYRAMQSCGLPDCSALHVTIIFCPTLWTDTN